jgi:hypothetical protein
MVFTSLSLGPRWRDANPEGASEVDIWLFFKDSKYKNKYIGETEILLPVQQQEFPVNGTVSRCGSYAEKISDNWRL